MYERLAPFYDLIHKDLTGDIDFVVNLAAAARDPIIDCGSGTGRLLIPLARAGHEIVGVDSSVEMLAIAEAKLSKESPSIRAHVRLVQADIVEYRDQTAYGVALISYNTLMHLRPRQARRFIRNLSANLANDARLFIDLANPFEVSDASTNEVVVERVLCDDDVNGRMFLNISSFPGNSAERRQLIWRVYGTAADDRKIDFTIEEVMQYYYPHQIELYLSEANLKLEGFVGDYDGHPFSEESERMIVLAKRNRV